MSQSTSKVVSIRELINPTIRQAQAFAVSLTCMFLLYGGAMGGGKSYFLRWWCIREAMRLFAKYGVRGVRIGLFSMDYPTLRDRQISRIAFEVPEWLGKVHDSQVDGFSIVLAPKWGFGVIVFRNLDNPSKYNSSEFAGIAVEELTENAEAVFHELRKRLRWPGIPQDDLHFVAAANPGGKGHAWVKKLWIDKDFPTELLAFADKFAYVPALALDNPHLDPAYYQNLLSLPEDMRKAYAEGSWDIFAGQYFSEWRKEIHVVEPFAIPWFWRVRRSGDWGETAPCAHVWIAYSPEGQRYIIHEVYGAGKSVKQQASEILAFEASLAERGIKVQVMEVIDSLTHPGVKVDATGVLDSACWDVTGRAESIAQQFAACGVHWVKSSKGPGSRVAGWKRLKALLHWTRDAEGNVTMLPRMRVFSTCTNVARTIPTLVYDKLNPEDLDSKGEDHGADAVRYGEEADTVANETPVAVMHRDDAAQMEYARQQLREAA